MQKKSVTVSKDRKTGKETVTSEKEGPKEPFKTKSISKEEFNDDDVAAKAAAISAKWEQQQKEKEEEEKRYENEDQAPYLKTKNNGPRINTEKKLSDKEQMVANIYKTNPNAYEPVSKSVEKVADVNRAKIEATLKNDEERAKRMKASQEFWNEQLKFRNKQSKKWGD